MMTMKGITLGQLNLGNILGCALKRNERSQGSKAKDRFFSIIMSESLFLIWKIRCEWRIQRDSDPTQLHSETEIHNRWVHIMNYRLKIDCLMTNRKYERKALSKTLVIQTWKNTLLDEDSLPREWVSYTGVLVGIKARRPPGRNR